MRKFKKKKKREKEKFLHVFIRKTCTSIFRRIICSKKTGINPNVHQL